MKTVQSFQTLQRELAPFRRKAGGHVGFVPTMGALHEGHVSLMRRARRENTAVVVSIFVNPLQFGAGEDLLRYPRNLKKDLALCRKAGVDIVYTPKAEGFYKKPFLSRVQVSQLTDHLCGQSRPGHFEGVATVVLKLFSQVRPDNAYFGKKDYQQLAVICQLVKDFDLPIRIRPCPIVREPDGLAMSSRNQYLRQEERQRALVLNQALNCVRLSVLKGERDSRKLLRVLRRDIRKQADRLDYAEAVNAETLEPISRISGRCLVAVAGYFGKARLIDNLELNV